VCSNYNYPYNICFIYFINLPPRKYNFMFRSILLKDKFEIFKDKRATKNTLCIKTGSKVLKASKLATFSIFCL
jgi:hypothetical protein